MRCERTDARFVQNEILLRRAGRRAEKPELLLLVGKRLNSTRARRRTISLKKKKISRSAL